MAETETSLMVPIDLVMKTKGLAFDLGGSLVKIVYRNKENLDEAESNTTGDYGHLQLVSFPKNQMAAALQYVAQRALIMRYGIEDKPEIFSTGVGCIEFGRTISETLNIRLKNLAEFDCTAKAFIHLASQLSREDFLEPRDLQTMMEVQSELLEEMKVFMQLKALSLSEAFEDGSIDFQSLDSQHLSREEKSVSDAGPLATCEDIYPCLLVLGGTAIAYMKINADKSFKLIDGSQRGGSALQGLGRLLTGCKNFEEFLELASRGDSSKVDVHANDLPVPDLTLGAEKSDQNAYVKAAEKKLKSLVFCFGKAAGPNREEFRPEDLAMAWLHYFVLDFVQCITLIAQLQGIRRIFFCGGVCNSALVRKMMTKAMTRRYTMASVFHHMVDATSQFDFIKPGSHLGALGALTIELEKLLAEYTNGTTSEG